MRHGDDMCFMAWNLERRPPARRSALGIGNLGVWRGRGSGVVLRAMREAGKPEKEKLRTNGGQKKRRHHLKSSYYNSCECA